MSNNKELEIRRQFLDEAEEYLGTLDSALLGLSSQRVDPQKINAALRAAHSVKGGAGMMGFEVLSSLAHRLEDSFKVLKVEKSLEVDPQLENLLLTAVDRLRWVVARDRQEEPIEPQWMATHVEPIFEQLHARLGDPQEENMASLLSPEEGQDIIPLLFETEVEGCLQRLEAVIENPVQPCLAEELGILAQELGGLGEMLQLPAFTQLCAAVTQALEAEPTAVVAISQAALQTWRRSQALVMVGQMDQLPTTLMGFVPNSSSAPPTEVVTEPQVAIGPEFEAEFEAEFEPFVFDVESFLPPEPVLQEEVVLEEEVVVQPVEAASVRESKVTDYKILDTQPDPAAAPDIPEDGTVRVPVKQLNQLNDLFGELTIERNGLDLYIKRLRTLALTLQQKVQTLEQVNVEIRTVYDRGTLSTVGSAIPLLGPALGVTNGDAGQTQGAGYPPSLDSQNELTVSSNFDALEMDRYSDLHSLSQQLMETIVQIHEVTDDVDLSLDDAEQTTRNLNKTAKQLQTSLTQLRMRPLSDLLDRFPRALREMSLQFGKLAKLEINGAGTLIDRNILEALNDPLMHLLRNAFDHGIESAETRLARGKSEVGLIQIQAMHRGNRTIITVRDDGEGIPIHKIRARAADMGLDMALLAAASDEELLGLIFEPGFSTSSHVTTLSGRGVGMDVVRSNLKDIRGEISVNTQAGQGTTFTLSLPFTLSVVKILLVESNGMMLAFPTDVIQEMFLFKPEEVIASVGGEVLNWQGKVVQLMRLQRWLQFKCARSPQTFETPATIRSASVLVVAQGNQLAGIQIDRCWGEQEVTTRRVEGSLPLPTGFSSCTILGDGRVVPLVNVPELLNWLTNYERFGGESAGLPTQKSTLASATITPPALLLSSTSAATTILIVDDSINVRRFLALTLERAGYQVEQAKDGQEALERLEAGLAVSTVICDIEMPRLDGFGFLSKLKAQPQFQNLPVAMLTSRSGSKHRQLATSLGATAYFAKPYNEQVLLRTLAQMVADAAATN
jgi:two-component system, chemotaxis family, sensor histidine kinase and response regulator PixL